MRLSWIAGLAIAVTSLSTSPALAQAEVSLEGISTDELAEARLIIESMFPAEDQDEIFGGMMDDVGSQFAAAAKSDPIFEEPGIRAIMDDFFAGLSNRLMPLVRKHMPSILEATAVAYTNEFTLEELQDIRTFAQTESGRRYFRQVTSLLADPAVAAANQAYFAELQRMQGQVRAEIQQKVIDYLTENPDVAERSSANAASRD